MSPEDERPHGLPNLRERQKTTADVLTRPQAIAELEDGYELTYPRADAWSSKLEAFTQAWSKSCPHMTFEVVDGKGGEGGESDGPLRLHIRGPEGTKQFVEGARIMLTSHLNPAPNLKNRVRQAARMLTSPLRILPEFLIIGAKKCGTTSLYAYLTKHPSIAPAYSKEIYYFNAHFHRPRLWYRAFFPTVFERSLARLRGVAGYQSGEATPDYLFEPQTPERVLATLPRAKLIAILRNPADRAYSFYQHNLRAGIETLSFEDAIDAEEDRVAAAEEKRLKEGGARNFAYDVYTYCQRGIYVEQVQRWTDVFPRSQLAVFSTEELQSDPAGTVRRAVEFLGLPPWEMKDFRKLNAIPYPDMNPATRRELQRRFEPHNRRLYELLGTDFGWEKD